MSRIRGSDLLRMVVAWLFAVVALAVAVELLPELDANSIWPLLLAAAVAGVAGVIIRPVLVEVSARIGWIAVGAVAVLGQAVVIQIALEMVPGITSTSFWSSLAAAWIAAVVDTILTWLLTSTTPEALAAALRRTGQRHPAPADPDVDGVLFVQLDGVAHPVMQWALQSGTMPTLRRWVDAGSHVLHPWTAQLPCTTPASQQGILHGTCARVPAFRWYDRELGRVLVANRPADAAIIEDRASTGRGLLADDGISVSNLFSGDAPRSSMTMSKMHLSRGSRETRRAFGWFMVRPDGFARSLARTLAELGRERFQARRQRLRAVWPRVPRSWSFAGMRAVSNGMLRDMNTAVVADEMMRGTKSIYVDYVDYDEVAHHAGGVRIEALRSLEALDEVLAILANVAADAPRRYHIVALSDHGQSMGAPFADRYGVDLAGVCASLIRESVASIDENVESSGRVASLKDDLVGSGRRAAPAASEDASSTVVLGSGNLGLVYFTDRERLTLEDITDLYPALIPGLVSHQGVSFVAVLGRSAGPVAIGAEGTHRLCDGVVEGVDPLEPFGEYAAPLVARATEMDEAPDLYVNSIYDPATEEIAAFEGLVGAHGGLGGWQDRGMLLAPVELLPDPPHIVGAEHLHQHLVGMLERLGHRGNLHAVGDR